MNRFTTVIMIIFLFISNAMSTYDYPITTCDFPASHLGIIRTSHAARKNASLFERVALYLVRTINKPTGIVNVITNPCVIGIDIAAPLMRLLCTLIGYECKSDQSYIDLSDTHMHDTCMRWRAHDFEGLFLRIMDNPPSFTAQQEYTIAHCYPLYQFPGFIDFIKRFACYQGTIRQLYTRILCDKQFMLHIERLPGISCHQFSVIVEHHYHALIT
jgi:hypothetical protein